MTTATKYKTISYPYGYKNRKGEEVMRTFRSTRIGDRVYAYERQGSRYHVFTLASDEADESGIIQIYGVECMDLPSAKLAKLAIEAHSRGVDVEAHLPADMYAHVAGGGWGGHSRYYRMTPECRTCGRLSSTGDDSYGSAEAREWAWDHWQENVEKALT